MENEIIKETENLEVKTDPEETVVAEETSLTEENAVTAVEEESTSTEENAVTAVEEESTSTEENATTNEAPEKVFCANCGAELKEGSKFCPKCGTVQETPVERNLAVEEFNKQLDEKKKKKKKKLIISLVGVVVAILLFVGGKFAFTAIRHAVGMNGIEKAVESYRIDEIDYDTAIEKITKLKSSKDIEVAESASDAEEKIEELKKSKEHFEKGNLYKGKKDYANALLHYEAVIKDDPNYSKAQDAIKEMIPLWKKTLPSEIDDLVKNDKGSEADGLIKTFLKYAPEDKEIANIGKFIEAENAYKKGHLNEAQDIYKTLPKTLAVNGITVQSRLDTLSTYKVFVDMCGKWKTTSYYFETKEKWRSGRWSSWYNDGDEASRYMIVTCTINDNGTVTVDGDVEFLSYTNYSSISSYLKGSSFTSDFTKTVSLPTNGKVSFDFSTGDFVKGYTTLKDSQSVSFDGKSFSHKCTITYYYSSSCTEYYTSRQTFGECVEKY